MAELPVLPQRLAMSHPKACPRVSVQGTQADVGLIRRGTIGSMFEESLLDVGVDESQFVRNVAARVDERSRDIDPTQWESVAEFSLGSRPVETLSSHQPDIATCPQREAETAGGGSVTLHNRFAPLNEAADAVSGVSRPKEFAMTEGSDTESCEFQGRLSRRLRLVWDRWIWWFTCARHGPLIHVAATQKPAFGRSPG